MGSHQGAHAAKEARESDVLVSGLAWSDTVSRFCCKPGIGGVEACRGLASCLRRSTSASAGYSHCNTKCVDHVLSPSRADVAQHLGQVRLRSRRMGSCQSWMLIDTSHQLCKRAHVQVVNVKRCVAHGQRVRVVLYNLARQAAVSVSAIY